MTRSEEGIPICGLMMSKVRVTRFRCFTGGLVSMPVEGGGYRLGRSFDWTSEPGPGKAVAKEERVIFVVPLHHASRRFYDFRLQVGDAVNSGLGLP